MTGKRRVVSVIVCSLAAAPGIGGRGLAQEEDGPAMVRFGVTADLHLRAPGRTMAYEAYMKEFVRAMAAWKPDFVIDLGDFACQCGDGPTTPELHDAQRASLRRHWAVYSQIPCPAYLVLGNHDVGWLRGGDESLTREILCAKSHAGEDITKQEWAAATGMAHRYYAFDVRGCRFIVLDGNNPASRLKDVARGRDGVRGYYAIDDAQMAWLAKDLAAHRGKLKIVFCHEELHHTPVAGSGQGGDAPFPPVGKQTSYVDNGWRVRDLLAADGRVAACFFGHKHESRWTVYGGVHYITLAAAHNAGSYARVTVGAKLAIEGVGKQRSCTLPLPARRVPRAARPARPAG